MIYIRYTISKISFSYIMYISIILCRNYLQIVRSNYVYFGQINESVCMYVCMSVCNLREMSISVYGVELFQKLYDVIKLCDKLEISKRHIKDIALCKYTREQKFGILKLISFFLNKLKDKSKYLCLVKCGVLGYKNRQK